MLPTTAPVPSRFSTSVTGEPDPAGHHVPDGAAFLANLAVSTAHFAAALGHLPLQENSGPRMTHCPHKLVRHTGHKTMWSQQYPRRHCPQAHRISLAQGSIAL